MANLVNDPGVKSGQSFLNSRSGGSSSGNSASNFSDVFKGIGTLVDLIDKNRQTDLANQVAKTAAEEFDDYKDRDPSQGGTKEGYTGTIPEGTVGPAVGIRSEQQDKTMDQLLRNTPRLLFSTKLIPQPTSVVFGAISFLQRMHPVLLLKLELVALCQHQ